ncbi:MAG: hypothetical protein II300_05700 [Bacteroidales bacterium]|nr:hypothetical protein [Bacteroidales bacterium]
MSKKLFVLFAILVSGFAIFAQSEMRDVVYLKNGSVVKGTIMEEAVGKYVRIDTPDGSIFFYEMNEIEKIVKEKVATPETKVETPETKVATNQNSMPVQNNNYVFMPPRKSTFGAGFLSFLIPGAGELYATNGDEGWGLIAWTLLGEPAIIGLGSLFGYRGLSAGLILAGTLHVIVWLGSMANAVELAKQTNIKNGYLSFKIGDKAHLGVRPEFSYNNMMMPSGGLSPQFTSGIGFSLSF